MIKNLFKIVIGLYIGKKLIIDNALFETLKKDFCKIVDDMAEKVGK